MISILWDLRFQAWLKLDITFVVLMIHPLILCTISVEVYITSNTIRYIVSIRLADEKGSFTGFRFFSNFFFTEIFSFQNGLAFTVRRGRYDIFFGKENSFWHIQHPLIVNQWFDATLTWTPDDGLKFYVNGKLVASDATPEQLNLPLASEPFKLMIGSAENGGGWSRAISIKELKVWKMAMKEEEIKRQSEGRCRKMTLKSLKYNSRKFLVVYIVVTMQLLRCKFILQSVKHFFLRPCS